MAEMGEQFLDELPPLSLDRPRNGFECVNTTLTSIMHTKCSSLPDEWTHFISIMALSRFMKENLLREAKEEFASIAFQREYTQRWITEGISAVPARLAALCDLNALLAHQPWKVDSEMFSKLVSTGWNSQPELLHAVVILCFFHSLSSIVVGKDLSIENLMGNFDTIQECAEQAEEFNLQLSESQSDSLVRTSSDPTREGNVSSHPNPKWDQNALRHFKIIRSRSIASLCLEGEQQNGHEDYNKAVYEDAKKYNVDDLMTQYVDFKPRRSERVKDLQRTQLGCFFGTARYDTGAETREKRVPYNLFNDFNWETEGFSIVSSLLPSSTDAAPVAQSIDSLIQSAMAVPHLSSKTTRHIWSYVHLLYGVQFEDFDYSFVNRVLPVRLKVFIKAAACYPDRAKDVI